MDMANTVLGIDKKFTLDDKMKVLQYFCEHNHSNVIRNDEETLVICKHCAYTIELKLTPDHKLISYKVVK